MVTNEHNETSYNLGELIGIQNAQAREYFNRTMGLLFKVNSKEQVANNQQGDCVIDEITEQIARAFLCRNWRVSETLSKNFVGSWRINILQGSGATWICVVPAHTGVCENVFN